MYAIQGFLCCLLLYHSVSSLELTGPSIHAARLESDTRVPCPFTVDNPTLDPNDLTIFWYFQDKEILRYDKTVKTTSPRYSLSTGVLVMGIANLTISNIQIPDGGMYKCSVTYRMRRKEKEVRLDIGAPPQVTVTEKMALMNVESVLRCFATGFYPVDIDIKWFKDGEKLNNISTEDPRRNLDRTYSVNSTVTITPTGEDRERIFSCRVYHDFLQEPLQKDFRLVYEDVSTDRSLAGIFSVCSVLVVILIIIIAAILWWRRKPWGKVSDITGPPKLIDGEEAVLSCKVDDAPEDLCVTWLIRRAGEEQEIQTSQMRGHSEEEMESLLDMSYVINSQWERCQYLSSLSFIPHMERHKDATFICRGVSGHHTDEKMFPCCMIYVKPKLSKPITRRRVEPGRIKYLVNLENFNPKKIKFVWTCDVETAEEVVPSTEPVISENPDTTYNVSSEVIIPEDRHKDPGFRVRVTWEHASMEKSESRELSMRGKPQMSAPIQITMAGYYSSQVQFSLNLQRFYPKDIKISWCWKGTDVENPLSAEETISEQKDDLTYEVTSVVRISKHLFRDPVKKFIVEWKHKSLETPERRSLSARDLPWRPHVGPLKVPKFEDGKKATLTCDISGYFPDLLSVTWCIKKDGNETALPRESSKMDRNYKVPDGEKKQTDHTYSCEASVTFTPIISSDQGSEIICRVEHPSEERPIERSTGPLHIGEVSHRADY